MVTESRAKWIAIIGYALASPGIVIYTQLGRIVDLRLRENVLNVLKVVVLSSMALTLGGFLTAIVGSAIWARRSPTRQPLKIAALIGVGSFFLCLAVDVNVHGPSAILMFLLAFSVVNVLSALVVTYW